MSCFLTENFCYQVKYDDGCNVILNNNKTISIDCLTWLNSNARVKIYYTFVCQIANFGVNKQIGNHIIDFIDCPDLRLKKIFSSNRAKEHSITRLEVTVHNYTIRDYYKIDEVYINN